MVSLFGGRLILVISWRANLCRCASILWSTACGSGFAELSEKVVAACVCHSLAESGSEVAGEKFSFDISLCILTVPLVLAHSQLPYPHSSGKWVELVLIPLVQAVCV